MEESHDFQKIQKHCAFDDIPWEVKLIIFEYAQDRLVISHVNKEWRWIITYGKKEKGSPTEYINDLAENGHLELLKWLSTQMDITKYWSKWACAYAAGAGHLDILKWLRDPSVHKTDGAEHSSPKKDGFSGGVHKTEGGVCPWDWRTCAYAALYGHLDVLEWLKAEGCPWDEQTWMHAAWKS